MRITRFLWVSVVTGIASLNVAAQVENYSPVTEDMLHNAPQGEWLNWRGGDNSWGYSPLEQITVDNVNQMQLAWSWALGVSSETRAIASSTAVE